MKETVTRVVNDIAKEHPVVQVAAVAAVAWSAWSLIPVGVGALVALLLIAKFALDAVGALGWGLGVGAAALVVTVGVYMRLPDSAKSELRSALVLGIKFAAVGSVGIGSMSAIMSMMPTMPSVTESQSQGAAQNIEKAAVDIQAVIVIIIAVVVPVLLASIAVFHAVKAHKAGQSRE